MSKFRNKYRVESARLANWDYSKPGAYFVTIITKNREHLFGRIENDQMLLNYAGKNAHRCWMNMPKHFPHVALDEFVIMPNHVHGVIFIVNEPNAGNAQYKMKYENVMGSQIVETQNFASLRNTTGNKFGPQSKNLGSVIRGYKIGVTKWFRGHGNNKTIWQARFHDHIIRDENELNNIRRYIINNPLKWNNDDYNKHEAMI